MLKPVSNRSFVLACLADCPADNQACQLALFLYGTLATMPPTLLRWRKNKTDSTPGE